MSPWLPSTLRGIFCTLSESYLANHPFYLLSPPLDHELDGKSVLHVWFVSEWYPLMSTCSMRDVSLRAYRKHLCASYLLYVFISIMRSLFFSLLIITEKLSVTNDKIKAFVSILDLKEWLTQAEGLLQNMYLKSNISKLSKICILIHVRFWLSLYSKSWFSILILLHIFDLCWHFNHVYALPLFNMTLSITVIQKEIFPSFEIALALIGQIICMDSSHII